MQSAREVEIEENGQDAVREGSQLQRAIEAYIRRAWIWNNWGFLRF